MIDYKHWYHVLKDMQAQPKILRDDSDLYGLNFQDYFVLNRVLEHTRAKRIGWIGGFSNLDFFVSQHKVDSITECTNVDPTPVSDWCKVKHRQYIEKYWYQGRYEFIEEKYQQPMLQNVDFLSSITPPLSDVNFEIMPNLETFVQYHYGSPKFMNTIKKQVCAMPQRIITNNIVVYSTHVLEAVLEDCLYLEKIVKSDVGKISDVIYVDDKRTRMNWHERISGLSYFNKLTK